MHPVTTEDHITALAALRARRTIGELVASLSDRQRTILDLRLRRGLSTQETADIMGTTVAAVLLGQHRALARLRAGLRST
ncbi:sigma-70-like protein [Rhodococcus sp. SMB37]|uniref:sigma factor-like helix-turn-helix DNA-binding protein n=1 Tax=Rhodococcus sp. SMB37 TaxID=2512213 RepID=UPI00104460DD|nr:sigma factor-like helix-turn-helix DNA-binding protein [Rhodococcus sp. SMB37]TCN49844.1 sigma-70-like protein [Rhodococcus sp. SMB37]